MPMGPGLGGLAYFAGVKLAGYTGYAYFLRKRIFDDIPNGGFSRTVKIGATRTGIGLASGIAYGGLAFLTAGIFGEGASSGVYYLSGLLPIRFLEWWLLLWIFFRSQTEDRSKIASGIGLGIVVSYLLDAVGIGAALVLPGGVWVC
jgi:hypothetical protein